MGKSRSDEAVHGLGPVVRGLDAASAPTPKSIGRQQTARKAVSILTELGQGFIEPTKAQRKALSVAFAMKGKVLYGAAFDVVRMSEPIDLTDPAAIASQIEALSICEIKSTRKESIADDFRGYFFDLTTAELLVAQSLGDQYKFAFVNTVRSSFTLLSLTELFAKSRKIYPKWAVQF